MLNFASQLRFSLLDLQDWCGRALSGKLHLPPMRLRDVGDTDFESTGREFLSYFVRFCDLQPTARILEIGCGIGRIALPLTGHLSGGSYVGMDVVETSIRWCQQHITPKHQNFQFYHVDLFNGRYNRNGITRDEDYRFPFADESFDFIFLTSVFTHLLPPGIANYLSEIRRLLSDDGQVFMSFFLLNQKQGRLALQGRNAIDFKHAIGVYQVRDAEIPENAVAYDESYLIGLFDAYGFGVRRPVMYGTWNGCTDGLSFQDMIITTKTTAKKEAD